MNIDCPGPEDPNPNKTAFRSPTLLENCRKLEPVMLRRQPSKHDYPNNIGPFLAVRHFLSDILLGFSPAAAADEVINKPPHTSLGSQHVLCALVKKARQN